MEWFKTWFNSPYYHILYKNRDYKEAEAFLTLLLKNLDLPKGASIIDLGCGKGRHSVFLNRLGYDVLGLDLSTESIVANKIYENESLKFEVHDMRDEIHSTPVDAVFNLFTSFGYFMDPKDDQRVFSSVSKILKPGGYFVLDFLNRDQVMASLVPKSKELREGLEFQIDKRIEEDSVVKEIRFTEKGEDYFFYEKVKLHTTAYMDALALHYGFEKLATYGDYSLSEFQIKSSPRALSIYRKVNP